MITASAEFGAAPYAQTIAIRQHRLTADEGAEHGAADTGPIAHGTAARRAGLVHHRHRADVRAAQGLGPAARARRGERPRRAGHLRHRAAGRRSTATSPTSSGRGSPTSPAAARCRSGSPAASRIRAGGLSRIGNRHADHQALLQRRDHRGLEAGPVRALDALLPGAAGGLRSARAAVGARRRRLHRRDRPPGERLPVGRAVVGARRERRDAAGWRRGRAGERPPTVVQILARPNGPLVVHGTLRSPCPTARSSSGRRSRRSAAAATRPTSRSATARTPASASSDEAAAIVANRRSRARCRSARVQREGGLQSARSGTYSIGWYGWTKSQS